MTVTYPTIRAARRSFTPGGYAVTEPTHLEVDDAPRLWGNQPTDARLELEYTYLNETEVAALLTAWNNSLSGFIKLTLPSVVSCSIVDTGYRDRITGASNAYSWFFESEPEIKSRRGRLADVSVTLIGRIQAP